MATSHNENRRQPTPIHNRWWWVKSIIQAALAFLVGIGLIFALGVTQRMGWIGSTGGSSSLSASKNDSGSYTCPMHPQIRQPNLGRCPICGMELVPATTTSQKKDPFAVSIEPAARRVAGIRTTPVIWQTLNKQLQTIGEIRYDESRLASISSYVDGRIEDVLADYTGVKVAKKDHLVVLYTPELYSAQVEYLTALDAVNDVGPGAGKFVLQTQRRLARNARRKLVEMGMTEPQVRRLEKTKKPESRLTIYSPIGGTVIEKKAAEGDYVKTGQVLYKIANLSIVWLMLEMFPEDAALIRHAQKVQATVQSLPEKVFTGRVAFIDPVVNPKTRTVSVRVEMPNSNGLLKPGDYANATILVPVAPTGKVYDAELAGKWISPMHPQIIREKPGKCPICNMALVPATRFGYSKEPMPPPQGLVLPRRAILHAGKYSVVYVETQPGRFEIRPVILGPVLNGSVVVKKGVEEGEEVAVDGNFLIDSQMQLAGKPSLIDPTRAIKAKPRSMHLRHFVTHPVPGKTGEQLEKLYDSYFAVQKALAADKKPPEEPSQNLHRLAKSLLASKDIPAQHHRDLNTISTKSEHLHHLSLKEARGAFGPISESVIRLAARLREKDTKESFLHFYCPMVKQGRGDWLQPKGPLANPYYGSQMLRCGNTVHHLMPEGRPQRHDSKKKPKKKSDHDHQHDHSH
ncbi:MAG: efflux RND transporter periplasmic adaptor subunit [Gemmataceae bacterium]